jgi:hypothetical protein
MGGTTGLGPVSFVGHVVLKGGGFPDPRDLDPYRSGETLPEGDNNKSNGWQEEAE